MPRFGTGQPASDQSSPPTPSGTTATARGCRTPSTTSARTACSPSPCPPSSAGWAPRIRETAIVMRELAQYCGSTALAMSMHQHVTAFTAWRYRRELPGAEATLRRVAEDGIVLVSTGGADFTSPRGQAVKVEGGYRVSGRKIFASQSPAGTVMSTMFPYDDPERGLRVLNMAVPFGAGVTVHDNWDTLGMRGTGKQRRHDRRRVRARREGARRSPVRRGRPAAPGDREHRVLDRQRRLPRRRRVGGRARAPRRRRQGDRSDRAAAGRPDAAPAAGRRRGPTTAPWPSSATTRHRRWRRSPR